MTSITDSSLIIQTSCESVPSTPCWLGEVVLMVSHLRKFGVLDAISSQVRFARRRFGHYEVIDFLAVLAGLRHQWRTHPGGVLRAAPAFCAALYGLVRPRETPLPFGALTLSCELES